MRMVIDLEKDWLQYRAAAKILHRQALRMHIKFLFGEIRPSGLLKLVQNLMEQNLKHYFFCSLIRD